MEPTIYFLEDKTGNGKPKVIQALINRMILKSNELNLIIRPLDFHKDTLCIIEAGKLTIGLMSHENTTHSSSDLLRFLHEERCAIIVCTSLDRDDLTKVIASQVTQGNYQSVFLKSIWSPVIEIAQLLNYEVTKLEEIISLHLDNTLNGFTTDYQNLQLSQDMEAV